MSPEPAPLRSYLFVPASEPDKIVRAVASAADAVVVDLEDAVAESARVEARDRLTVEGLNPRDGLEAHVRVGWDEDEPSIDDAIAALRAGATAIRIPKVSASDEVARFAGVVSSLEPEGRYEPGRVRLYPTIESALGVTNAKEIATAHPSVSRLVFGERDFLADTGASSDVLSNHARCELVIASRAAGIAAPVDGAYTALDDPEGLRKAAESAASLGFFGKSAIHPAQIEVINQVFTPNQEAIEDARQIVAAYEDALEEGVGAIAVNGSFIDEAVVRAARTMLERWA